MPALSPIVCHGCERARFIWVVKACSSLFDGQLIHQVGKHQMGSSCLIAVTWLVWMQHLECAHQSIPNKAWNPCAAGHLVRGAATVGGNVVLARQHALQSDYCTIMIAAGAEVEVTSRRGARYSLPGPLCGSVKTHACKTIILLHVPNAHAASIVKTLLGSLRLHLLPSIGKLAADRKNETMLETAQGRLA